MRTTRRILILRIAVADSEEFVIADLQFWVRILKITCSSGLKRLKSSCGITILD